LTSNFHGVLALGHTKLYCAIPHYGHHTVLIMGTMPCT